MQNFVSAATGIALAVALIRGFARASAQDRRQLLGRPDPQHALRAAAALHRRSRCSASGRACRRPSAPTSTRPRSKAPSRPSRSGPVASQIAIKMLGTNGGGFFNANSAHPFENPTALANFVQMLLDLRARRGAHQRLRPHGRRRAPGLGDPRRHGRAVPRRRRASPTGRRPPATRCRTRSASTGGNMEGKEVRFGIATSALFAVVTTAASSGAVNAMHDSFTPLGGMVPLINMQLGEIIFGGVGSGLYGMLMFVIVAVFVAGLMVGRTPEYLGKKIEAKEVKMAMLAILILPLSMLGFTAVAVVLPVGGGLDRQRRPARLQRDPLCLHLGSRQQRLGLRRAHRQHALVQHDARHRDADRALLRHHPGAGDRRLARGEEDRSGLDRHASRPMAACSSACWSASS